MTRKNNCLLERVTITRTTPRTCTWGLQCYLGGPRLIGALITDGGEGGPYPGKHINNTSIVKHINNTSTPKNREEKWKGSQTRTVLRKICCFLERQSRPGQPCYSQLGSAWFGLLTARVKSEINLVNLNYEVHKSWWWLNYYPRDSLQLSQTSSQFKILAL